MRKGKAVYAPPLWSDEDSRTLLNWLSTRVNMAGTDVDADHEHEHERPLIEWQLWLARAHGLIVLPGVYLLRPHAPRGQSARGKPRKRKAA